MHEMGVADSILHAVDKELLRYPGRRALKVNIRVGRYAGVEHDSLQFCFESMVKGTTWEPLELEIEQSAGDELDFTALELDDL